MSPASNKTRVAGEWAAGRQQGGFSMIEMLISVAIGLLVTGAVLYTVSTAGVSGRKQEVQSTMHDLGNLAMVQLGEHLRMSGFSIPASEVAAGDMFELGEKSVFGCQAGFAPGQGNQPWNWATQTCEGNRANTAASDAIALRFQLQPGGRNWDCLGNAVIDSLTAAGMPNTNGLLVADEIQERFYVRTTGTASGNPGLFCSSSINPGVEQLVADNVDQMRIHYGVSAINDAAQELNRAFDATALIGRTTKYYRASEMADDCTPGALPDNSWCAVNTVQVCLVMRSNDNVNDEANTPYVDCEGTVRYANDRRLRQAFTMTVAIRNKIER